MSVEHAQSAAATLVTQLQARAARQPEQTAYIYLADGEAQEQRLTFSQLDQRARVIATELRRRGLAGRPVLLLYPSGLEAVAAFCGCLYAGALAVLTFPPYPGRPLTVQQATAKDAGAALILTTRQILADVEPRLSQAPDLQARPWVASDTLTVADAEPPASPAADSLAALSYTSGSTSAPKGVMLSHHNLVHDMLQLAGPFGLTDEDVWVSWAPQHHIAGLMISLVPILLGAQVVLMPAQAFVERPARWLENITRRRATVSFGFNFAFQQCLTRITPEEKAALDLSGWRLALVGGERVDAGLLGQFAEAFAASGFRREALRPAYGLSEASAYGSGLPSAA
ncbi:MAG: AMP-binding protein, partial [Anaerolineales bacterium]|nr:AMP-binding protein [Anaerolineales bacterium]